MTADASKSDQERQRLKFTVKIIFFDATIGAARVTRSVQCTTRISLHLEQQWVLQ